MYLILFSNILTCIQEGRKKMSVFGNDCHFYYNSTCIKGDSCQFRHCEAAKASDITCTFWRQKTCTKPNCSFRHSETLTQVHNKNRADIPCYWETQPSGCTKVACPFKHQSPQSKTTDTPEDVHSTAVDVSPSPVVEVQPVVVNLAEDSDVEMASPVKAMNIARTAVPGKAIKKIVIASCSGNNIPDQSPLLTENKPDIKSQLIAKGPDPKSRKSVKERLKIGVADTNYNSVRARVGVHKFDTSIKNRLGTQQHQGTSEETTQDDSGGDNDLTVKSLEQIQREKALRSMGLIELKDGKIMKIADWEKEHHKEQTAEHEHKEDEEEESDENEKKEETDDEKEEHFEEENEEEEEDDLEEPEEIELCPPEDAEHVEDTRSFVSSGVQRGGRRIVVENNNPVDNSTIDVKDSLKQRLGAEVGESSKVVSKSSIRNRLTLTVESANQGTIKTITGIKRRLGTVGNESTILDARQKLKQKRRGTPETITQSIARVLKEENSDCADDNSEKILPIRKRGWRRSTKAADGSDSDVNQAVTPEVSVLGGSPKKLNATEEAVKMAKRQRKEEDGGAKLQNMLTQRLRNTVWSNRNNQRARTGGETLDSLGIGIIDIKGGKVVKMGKNKEEGNTQSKREDKLLAQIEKLKGSKKEIKVYVPPAQQKAGIGVGDTEKTRGGKSTSETENDLRGDDSDDLKVKTFSEIMAAKRQRQKQLTEKKNAELCNKKSIINNLELPHESKEDSNEGPADVLKMAQMITGSIDSSSKLEENHHRHHQHSKKKSKWRKKKESKERKNKTSDNDKKRMHEMEKTLSYVYSEDSQNRKSDKLEDDVSDREGISSTKKRVEQLLSDSWLDLDVDNTEGETGSQNEDDLLREIDELLA
ncbi:uncharacterized protein LOC111116352 isoform X1 [Crassostrea virginica]